MAVSCNPGELAAAAAPFRDIPEPMKLAILIYLLQVLAENAETSEELLENSKCLGCIPPGEQIRVLNYLLCQLVGV